MILLFTQVMEFSIMDLLAKFFRENLPRSAFAFRGSVLNGR